jgi:hypothetical protein
METMGAATVISPLILDDEIIANILGGDALLTVTFNDGSTAATVPSPVSAIRDTLRIISDIARII